MLPASGLFGRRPMPDSSPFSARALPDGLHSQGRREKLLRLPIGELSSWQIVVSCSACRIERVLLVFDLVKRFGPERTLVVLVPRLRCGQPTCRRPPSSVILRNKYPAAMGGPGFVEVDASVR